MKSSAPTGETHDADYRDCSKFFEACETGKGWEGCKAYYKPDATFSAQAEPLAAVKTLRQYTDWMKGLLTFMPDGRYELKSFGTDDERKSVCAIRRWDAAAKHRTSPRFLSFNSFKWTVGEFYATKGSGSIGLWLDTATEIIRAVGAGRVADRS
jgi:hypothetical protein